MQILVENNAQTTSNKAERTIEIINAHKNILMDYEVQHLSVFCDESKVLTESELKNLSILIQKNESLENLDNQDDDNELSAKDNTSGLEEIKQYQSNKKIKLDSIGFNSSSSST